MASLDVQKGCPHTGSSLTNRHLINVSDVTVGVYAGDNFSGSESQVNW